MSGPIVSRSTPHGGAVTGAAQPDSAGAPAAVEGAVRIDYHVHTRWSPDSDTDLAALLARARQAGLSRICVTDHDTLDGALALQRIAPPELDVVVGCEFNTDDGSQLIGLGLTAMIHEQRPLELMRAIREGGGVVLVPHPFRRGSGLFRPDARRSAAFVAGALALTDLVECFNGRDTFDNNERNLRFALEHGLPAVAGSDAHTPDEIGSVFVEYQGDAEVAHGTSARRICFPDRPHRREHALKRTAMEFYHRNADRLPGPVNRAYRLARERRSDAPLAGGTPRVQLELRALAGTADER